MRNTHTEREQSTGDHSDFRWWPDPSDPSDPSLSLPDIQMMVCPVTTASISWLTYLSHDISPTVSVVVFSQRALTGSYYTNAI